MGELLQLTGAAVLARAQQHFTREKQKNTFHMARVKSSKTRPPHLELPGSPLVTPIKTLMAGVVMK